jgi:hypothetical protein
MPRVWETLLQDASLSPFLAGVNEFVSRHLPSKQEDGVVEEGKRPKIFADPVEGYAALYAWEVSLVDTPLFQRLRGIRQLGFTYLVYPTLGYSRFEHTLGALARAEQIISQLRENIRMRDQNSLILSVFDDDKIMTAFRLAVLCHDIGHCLFSHVSEAVIAELPGDSAYPPMRDICRAFSEYAGKDIPPAEVFSCSIVCSEAFISFLSSLGITGRGFSAQTLATHAARLILGMPLQDRPETLFLGQLLSSGLDVDKLDYMLRESHFTGISLGISLRWLLHKLTVEKLSGRHLPKELLPRLAGVDLDTTFWVLSLEQAGKFAFEEFCIARLTLHEKIYLHAKVRAAEAEARERFSHLPAKSPIYAQAHQWLGLRESMIDEPAMLEPNLFLTPEHVAVSSLGLNHLGCRKLLFRGFAFGWQNSISDPLGKEPALDSRTAHMLRYAQADPVALKGEIVSEMRRITEVLTKAGEKCPVGEPYVIVDPPRLRTLQQGHHTIHFCLPLGLPLSWALPIDRLADNYHYNRALTYVFAEKQFLPIVLLAAEKVAWDRHRVMFIEDGFVSGNATDEARRLKVILQKHAFYAKARALQPRSKVLTTLEAQEMVERIAADLAIYESRTRRHVTPESVNTFVSQFPEELQLSTLRWLRHLELVKPEDLLRDAFTLLAQDRRLVNLNSVAFCALGGASDSASHITYAIRDVVDQVFANKDTGILSLPEALSQGFDAYVLYDDNVNTGLQCLNILASWMGIELPSNLGLNEEHVGTLGEAATRELKSKPLALAFAMANEGGCDALRGLLVKHMELRDEFIICCAGRTLRRQERLLSGDKPVELIDNREQLRKFLAEQATAIFEAETRSSDRASKRSLGDGNAEAMVVFPYNCPTMTVAALWLDGHHVGGDWIPLVERSRRRNRKTNEFVGEDA